MLIERGLLSIMASKCSGTWSTYKTYTTANGCPFMKPAGPPADGRTLALNDHHLVESLAHFNREKIPERAVHAKGAAAYGEFEVLISYGGVIKFPKTC